VKKKPKPKTITQMDIIKSVRRPLPPPSVKIESKKARETVRPKHKKAIREDYDPEG